MTSLEYALVAAAISRTRMASTITGTAKEKSAKAAALRLVATDLAATFAHEDPEFSRSKFMAQVGLF